MMMDSDSVCQSADQRCALDRCLFAQTFNVRKPLRLFFMILDTTLN